MEDDTEAWELKPNASATVRQDSLSELAAPSGGNSAELIESYAGSFQAMADAIEQAEKFVHVESSSWSTTRPLRSEQGLGRPGQSHQAQLI
jgi:hypothetical protein